MTPIPSSVVIESRRCQVCSRPLKIPSCSWLGHGAKLSIRPLGGGGGGEVIVWSVSRFPLP